MDHMALVTSRAHGALESVDRMRDARVRGKVSGMSATFIFLMVVLKLPIFALFYIVWWAVHAKPEPEPVTGDDGGTKRPINPRPRHPRHPRPALPRNPRRGPHGAQRAPAPSRTRTVVARARSVERRS